ncbi:MAG: UrcA family protein [Steroidobacteraceae bacterium]
MSRVFSQRSYRPHALAALIALGIFTTATWLGSPAAASAAQPYETTVYYNLLDLSSDHGTRALYRRIVNAAETVCPPADSLNLNETAASKECQQEAIASAVAKVGSARLAAVRAQMLPRHG